jgi:hypothetical protein
MVKKKDSDTDSSSSTDTDNEQKNNIETSTKDKKTVKKSGLSKKAKLYIAIAVVLLIGGAYMWYKNKKNNASAITQVNTGVIQTPGMSVPSVPVAQSVMLSQGNAQHVPDF